MGLYVLYIFSAIFIGYLIYIGTKHYHDIYIKPNKDKPKYKTLPTWEEYLEKFRVDNNFNDEMYYESLSKKDEHEKLEFKLWTEWKKLSKEFKK